MSEQNYSDPLKMWKQLYDVNEKYWGKMMNDVVQKEEFSEWMGSVIDFNLFCKKAMNDQSKVMLEASNISSKEDIANVASLVINLETKVDAIDDQLFNHVQQESDLSGIKKDIAKVKTETKTIHQQIDEIKTETKVIHQQMDEIKNETKAVQKQFNDLSTSLINIEQLLQQLISKK